MAGGRAIYALNASGPQEDAMSWVRWQRQMALARAIDRQRTCAHPEGRLRYLGREIEMRCVACGAGIARYVSTPTGVRVVWYFTEEKAE
jgi:hypothetical protein